MLKEKFWSDKPFSAMIGEKPVDVLCTQHNTLVDMARNQEADIVLFRYENKTNIYALRWKLGAVLNMGTADIDEAKGSIKAMMSMEASDGF